MTTVTTPCYTSEMRHIVYNLFSKQLYLDFNCPKGLDMSGTEFHAEVSTASVKRPRPIWRPVDRCSISTCSFPKKQPLRRLTTPGLIPYVFREVREVFSVPRYNVERQDQWINVHVTDGVAKEGRPKVQLSTRPGIEPGTSWLAVRDLVSEILPTVPTSHTELPRLSSTEHQS